MGEKAAVKFAHELIVVSETLQTYFEKTYGRQTVCIPNAPASYGESDPNFTYGSRLGLKQNQYIFFLGRLVPEKRPDLLVEAFCDLKPPGWKLVLAGGVSDTRSFSAKLLNKVASNRDILFVGELNGARLWEIMRGAGLFVLPSDVEGMPLVMLEAMREGIPVLGSNILPHRELVNQGGKGLLFEVGNIDSCIRSLEWSINHPHELAIMAKNAQRYVQEQYNWEKIATETLLVYRNVLNSSGSVDISTHSESKLSKVSGGD
jgi:glycosyltransferase involved in cell wall biosynthesis